MANEFYEGTVMVASYQRIQQEEINEKMDALIESVLIRFLSLYILVD